MAQRKVDDNIVLQLLREGKNQRQIVDHFNVSPVAIHKRLKRIMPKPKSLGNLTPKEQKFAVAVAEGKSRTQPPGIALMYQNKPTHKEEIVRSKHTEKKM